MAALCNAVRINLAQSGIGRHHYERGVRDLEGI
jgi:hypothetical protein